MPVFWLGKEMVFPPVEWATEEGIVAVGGDLSVERLIVAYSQGIFPWYGENDPILWWSPDPRSVILPGDIHISSSMKRLLKKDTFQLYTDRDFRAVINNCAKPAKKREKTWISYEIKAAYNKLHKMGIAHSVEAYQDERLVGGLYGISLGKCFVGESMFHREPNASKFAFLKFAQALFAQGFLMIDCQVSTPHLQSLGAREITRKDFLALLDECLQYETHKGKWDLFNGRL